MDSGDAACVVYGHPEGSVIPLRHFRIKASSAVLAENIYISGGDGSYYSQRTTEKITTDVIKACKDGKYLHSTNLKPFLVWY